MHTFPLSANGFSGAFPREALDPYRLGENSKKIENRYPVDKTERGKSGDGAPRYRGIVSLPFFFFFPAKKTNASQTLYCGVCTYI